MFLKTKDNGNLIKIVDVEDLFNPIKNEVTGRDQEGQEEQQAVSYAKEKLLFPSGEDLPRCWKDENYTTS
ncbi:acetyltransferase [Argonema galeatum]|uniref:acetyltransferase n=1 Tax=Argonema galeatum TaxID=2942762 RepID=UPI00201306C9|nr:acetyltransferase [Argonema galeatum]MCL1468697.1 acetyltransferase [Argonema galeatum A003/A1]